jgi:hypothetical protein
MNAGMPWSLFDRSSQTEIEPSGNPNSIDVEASELTAPKKAWERTKSKNKERSSIPRLRLRL